MTALAPQHGRNPLGLRIIGITKLVSASLLMAVAFGIFHLLGTDTGAALEDFVRHLHLDPDNRHITKALASITGMSRKELKAIDAGTFLYAALYIVEGIGLLLGKHWAEYLTIIATASLIPLEMYEIVQKVSAVRMTVLLVNVAIVIYLIWRLRADHRARPPVSG